MNLAIIYFSATGNTQKIGKAVKEQFIELNAVVDDIDITNILERDDFKDFSPYEAVVFGFPIHYWRAPRLIREWLRNLDGKGIKCSVFFTSGGVHVGAAHYDIKTIMDKQNFDLVLFSVLLLVSRLNT